MIMKRLFMLTVLATAAITMAHAQRRAEPGTPNAPTPTPGQSVPTGNASQSQPATQTTPAQPSQGGKPMPQAKSQEEFKAYQDAIAKTGAALETDADAFAAKYPDSELRLLLYRKAMFDYQNSNNAEKTIALAKKVLTLDSDSPEALVTLAIITAQSTRETDLDRDERLSEATKNAGKALETIDNDLIIPPNTPPERVQAGKNSLRAMAYDALGTVAMVKKDYPTAETNLRKSAELNAQPDPVTYLRLAVALDQQKKYQQALEAANQAVQYSADSPQANNLAKMERDRLQKLMSAPTPAATPPPTSPAPTAPTPSAPPAAKPPQQ
ncbi:MAG: hypothetical protein LAO06_20370 [Acidobacteriia bacterium]|nr:hypothetical protein [Terriglobia bacterium]